MQAAVTMAVLHQPIGHPQPVVVVPLETHTYGMQWHQGQPTGSALTVNTPAHVYSAPSSTNSKLAPAPSSQEASASLPGAAADTALANTKQRIGLSTTDKTLEQQYCHHPVVAHSSFSINGIGPTPHRSRKRDHCIQCLYLSCTSQYCTKLLATCCETD